LLNGVILVEGKPCLVTEDTLIYFFRILNNALLLNYIYQALGINTYKAILIPLFSIPVTHWRDCQRFLIQLSDYRNRLPETVYLLLLIYCSRYAGN
jgi:hypothetical protein